MISEIDDVVQWWRVIEWPDSLCLKHLCALRRPSSRMDSAFVADRKAATSNQHGVYRNDNVSHVCSSDLQLLYLNAWRISKPRFDIQTYQKTSNGAGWLLGSRSAIEPCVINCWLKKMTSEDIWLFHAKMPRCQDAELHSQMGNHPSVIQVQNHVWSALSNEFYRCFV